MPTGAPTVTPPTTSPPTTVPTMPPPSTPQPTTAPTTMRPTLGDGTTEPTIEKAIPTLSPTMAGGGGNEPPPVSVPQQAPVVVPTIYLPPTRTYFPTRTPVLEPTFQPTLQAGDPTRPPQEFRDIPDFFDPNQVKSASSMPKRNGRVVLMTISSLVGLHCLL